MDPSLCIIAFVELAEFSEFIGASPKCSRTFIEFSDFRKFREFEKSLKHELGSIYRSCLSHVSCCGAVVESRFLTKKVAGSSPFNDNFFCS